MKLSRIGLTLFGAALLFSAGTFARPGDTNKGALRLDEKVTVGTASLDPGKYTLEWNGNGPDVQVSVLKGRQTVATFPARIQDQANPMKSDAYSSADQANGKTLTAIYFGGKHYALQIEPTAAQQTSQSSPSASK